VNKAGRKKKYQNTSGGKDFITDEEFFYRVKNEQRIERLTESRAIKKLYAKKILCFEPLNEYEVKSAEEYKRITEQNKNKARYFLLSALIGSAYWLEKCTSLFWVFFSQPVNIYVSASMQPVYAKNWDTIMHTNTRDYGLDYIKVGAFKRRFYAIKEKLIKQQIAGLKRLWEKDGIAALAWALVPRYYSYFYCKGSGINQEKNKAENKENKPPVTGKILNDLFQSLVNLLKNMTESEVEQFLKSKDLWLLCKSLLDNVETYFPGSEDDEHKSASSNICITISTCNKTDLLNATDYVHR